MLCAVRLEIMDWDCVEKRKREASGEEKGNRSRCLDLYTFCDRSEEATNVLALEGRAKRQGGSSAS